MIFNPARRLLSRAAFQSIARPTAVPVAPRLKGLQVPRISNVRFNSSATVDVTVRDALNTALAEEYVLFSLSIYTSRRLGVGGLLEVDR